MAVNDESEDDIEFANGDTLAERLEDLDLEDSDTCSTEELRERLDL